MATTKKNKPQPPPESKGSEEETIARAGEKKRKKKPGNEIDEIFQGKKAKKSKTLVHTHMLLKASSIALLLLSSIVHPPARAPLSARSFMVSSSSAAYPCRGSAGAPTGTGCGAIPVGRGCINPPGTAAGAYCPWLPTPTP
ncbi:hypothetical protein B296_00036667 [Ensete ventricosum]|uniref:Uncharacterized protein n=1 Tax=Ensete ventricosum TaxID=4639 RepID=A0A426XZM9_ENSVE|nr:hypothetical protein B296_00036667 [Ensete ventricosum]